MMKKIFYFLTTTSLVSSIIIQSQIDNFGGTFKQFSQPNILGDDLDFSDFNHGYYVNIGVEHKTTTPSQVDININSNEYTDDSSLKAIILTKLDARYYNYEKSFAGIGDFFFWSSVEKIQFYDPQHVETPPTVINDFNIANLNTFQLNPSQGEWYTFNLKLVYVPNNTSFEFSLNLCNFNLNTFSQPDSINFSSTNTSYYHVYSISDNDAHYYNYNDVATINFNQMITSHGLNVAQFNTVSAAAFFLNPIHYHYWYQTYIDWYHYADTYINWQNSDYVFYPKLLLSSSVADLENGVDSPSYKIPQSYQSGGVYATWEYNYDGFKSNWAPGVTQQTDYDRVAMESGKNFSAIYYYASTPIPQPNPNNKGLLNSSVTSNSKIRGTLDETIAQSVNCFVYKNPDNTKIYIDNQAMVGADYMPRYYRFSFRTSGWPATTSLNANVFTDNPPLYQIQSNSIHDYQNFVSISNSDNTFLNIYGYKSDEINKYYTYAVKNSSKINNTTLGFINVNRYEINNKIYTGIQYLNNLIINNKPTLLHIKFWLISSSDDLFTYYGYNASDNSISFNLIVYPANYPTFKNYLDYNAINNNSNYNRDLKIHFDQSLVNLKNDFKLNHDDSIGFLDIFDSPKNYIKSGWGWINWNHQNISEIIYKIYDNKNVFKYIDNYITNSSSYGTLNKETPYTEGLFNLLKTYFNKNTVINIKFHLDDFQFSPSEIYDNFSALNPNKPFYEQLISEG